MNAKEAHTPGPWAIGSQDGFEIAVVAGASIIAEVNHHARQDKFVIGCGTTNPQANANLIAAAPDLLAACEALLKNMQRGREGPEIKQCEAAIRKAKGDV